MIALQLQKLENVNFTHFFTRPLGENYSNSSFDKSKGLNNQEAEKMKSICSNHIFELTLSNHFLQIDVKNSLHALYWAAPSGARLARPSDLYEQFTVSTFILIFMREKMFRITA